MEILLNNLNLDSLVELRNIIDNKIYSYTDGYFYICNVRSYGRNWEEHDIHNPHTLQELCYRYNGDDGIVDVYTNNPDLSIENYGCTKYVPTMEDYTKWKKYTQLSSIIISIEKELDAWDARDNVPFLSRPLFSPIYSREDLNEYKMELENMDVNFISPRLL